MTSRPPFFVLGAPRSGTSLLGDLLDAHANLRVTQELNLTGILRGVEQLTAHRARMERVGREEVGTRDSQHDASQYVRQLIEHELALHKKQRYADKHTVYCFEVPLLESLFPNAAYVHIIRDGRDVAYSALDNLSWSRHWRFADWTPKTYAQAAGWWSEHVQAARAAGARIGPERYIEVRYEALLASPRQALTRILEFLGEELDGPSLCALERVTSSPRRWVTTMSRREVREFESCGLARETMAGLGYIPADYPAPTTLEYPGELSAGVATLLQEGALDEASALLHRAEQHGVDHALLWNDLGAIEHARGEFAQAARCFVRALRYPTPPPAAAVNLLALPMRDESVFALVEGLGLDDPQMNEALEVWLLARGLSLSAARVVTIARATVTREIARNVTQAERGANAAAWRALAGGRKSEARARFEALSRAGCGLGPLGLALIDLAEGAQQRGLDTLGALLERAGTELEVYEELFVRLEGQALLAEALPFAFRYVHQSQVLRERIAVWLARHGLDADAAETLVQVFAHGRLPREIEAASAAPALSV